MLELKHLDLRTDPQARRVVKDETVAVAFAEVDGELMSLEGPNRYVAGDALITGSTGDRWVVLLHGQLMPRRMHEPLARVLASEGLHVVTLDLLGHGRSDRPEDPLVYSMSAFAEQVVATQLNSGESLQLSGTGPFLVLAKFPDGNTGGAVSRLVADACLGSRAVTADAPPPASLGAGYAPETGTSRSITSRFQGPAWIVVGVVCIGLAVLLARRGRRNQRPA